MDKDREVAFYLDEATPYLVRPNPRQKWIEEPNYRKSLPNGRLKVDWLSLVP